MLDDRYMGFHYSISLLFYMLLKFPQCKVKKPGGGGGGELKFILFPGKLLFIMKNPVNNSSLLIYR